MTKFWVELPTEITAALERAAVDAKHSGLFPPKRYGKKAMAELILTEWFARQKKGRPQGQIIDGPDDSKDLIRPETSRKLGVRRG